ncbi:tail fiber protein [Bradyrhizobium sp. BR 10289]|uniref:tail fiber protein n=1 Tax=Bradyrhizobium sp. BR 10289 TaxID=2749993 RepID=UPI001C65369B|nr:tail fiber protein [Bradyrhizobium sp. BR 10289]MBW7970943.1 hypothetical protein [Bradyrhizobium sp. BR 10289]
MPLETASIISDLVTSNPASSDPLNNADDHLRLIKSVVKNTFPNITGQVTATHLDLNAAAALLAGTRAAVFPGAGVGIVTSPGLTPNGDSDTGLYSPGANQLAVAVGGVRALQINSDKSITFDGALTTSSLVAPGIIPVGGMIMWLMDTLPTDGSWCWANGGTLSRTTPGAGLELFQKWGTYYGAGDGSTTFNVVNMQEVVPVGRSGMGGASSPGLLSSISAGVKTIIGSLFGADQSTLVTANLPPYTPAGSIANGAITIGGAGNLREKAGDNNNNGGGGGAFSAMSGTAPTLTASQGSSSFTGTAQGGSSTPFNNLPPSRVVNFIVRMA